VAGIFATMMVRFGWCVLMAVLGGSLATPVSAFHIHLHGVVTQHFTGDALKGVQVRLVKDSIERETVVTAWNGKYELYLERGYEYQVWFHRKDMVTKYVRIDAREIPLFPDVPFYEMDLQMTLFEWVDGFDFTVFNEPVALAQYKHSVRNLYWTTDYTQRRRTELQRLMIQYERHLVAQQKAAKGTMPARGGRKRKVVPF
jgi:hypothetical protein